ncbi:MAG: alpha/beta hydrolase [Verrucomicrobiota bacterium]
MKIPLNALLASLLLFALLPAAYAQNQGGDERLRQVLKRFPEADLNKDGKLEREELEQYKKKRQGTRTGERNNASAQLAPTHQDVKYGKHEKQDFDIWLAKSKDGKKTPLVIYIHGGGFRGGDKKRVNATWVKSYLEQGISFASMNYRLSDVGAYPMMMNDAARGLQLIRSKEDEWNLDSKRIACFGGSAGAGISLWLAFHDDLVDEKSEDPVARQSTRIVAAATLSGQSTYDLRTFREWFEVPNLKPHPAMDAFYGLRDQEDWKSDRVIKLMEDASAITHLDKDDVPVFMTYGKGDSPVDENTNPSVWVHHVRLGMKLKQAMDKLGVENHLSWRDHPSKEYKDLHAFLSEKVLAD